MEPDLPVQERPLVMDKSLYDMLTRYLEAQPYGLVKEIISSFDTVKRSATEGAEPETFYTMSRPATLHLLNNIMGKEDMVKTYMFIRQGYENLVLADQQRAQAAAQSSPPSTPRIKPVDDAEPKGSTKEKKVVELPVEDNVSADLVESDEPTEPTEPTEPAEPTEPSTTSEPETPGESD